MAGLQQYYFFPTDFFYPRPQPSAAATFETPSADPTVVPSQTQKAEAQNQHHQQQQHHHQPRSMIKAPLAAKALVCTPKRQSPVDKKLSKLSAKPLSYVVWLGEEDVDSF